MKYIYIFYITLYLDVLLKGDMDNSDMNLYWDSWDRPHLRTGASPRPARSRTTRCSVPSEDSIPYHNNNNNLNSDILAQASSVTSLSSTSPPSTPLLQRPGRGKCFLFFLIYTVVKNVLFSKQELNFQQLHLLAKNIK